LTNVVINTGPCSELVSGPWHNQKNRR
jgi:hypothetical protein